MKSSARVLAAYGLLLLVAGVFYLKPECNWDMVPYAALALSVEDQNPTAVHTRTYDLIRKDISANKFAQLIDSTDRYRDAAFKDPDFLSAQYPFYRLKPLYIATVYIAWKAGVPVAHATVLPSVIAFLATGMLLLLWSKRYLPEPYATLIGLAASLSPFMLQLGRSSTPDLLCGSLQFAGAFLVVERRRTMPAALALTLAVLVRADALLFVLAIAVYMVRMRWLSWQQLLLFAAGPVIAATAVMVPVWHIAGEVMFIRTAAERMGDHASFFSPIAYASGIALGMSRISFSSIGIVIGAAVLTIYLRGRLGRERRSDAMWQLVLFMLAHMAVRFVFHPIIEDRFLIGNYLLIGIALVVSIHEYASPNWKSPQKSLEQIS